MARAYRKGANMAFTYNQTLPHFSGGKLRKTSELTCPQIRWNPARWNVECWHRWTSSRLATLLFRFPNHGRLLLGLVWLLVNWLFFCCCSTSSFFFSLVIFREVQRTTVGLTVGWLHLAGLKICSYIWWDDVSTDYWLYWIIQHVQKTACATVKSVKHVWFKLPRCCEAQLTFLMISRWGVLSSFVDTTWVRSFSKRAMIRPLLAP